MKYQYYGLFLLDKNDLIKDLEIPKDGKVYLDHCTLMHCSNHDEKLQEKLDWFISHNLTKVHLTLDGLGKSDKAIAFRVKKTPAIARICKNEIPHITIWAKEKPVDSNFITSWEEIAPKEILTYLKKYD